jgi:putative ABC transport system permease protein
LERFLFQVSGTDPVTFMAVAGVLFGIALLASAVPGRRATEVDPAVSLRHE